MATYGRAVKEGLRLHPEAVEAAEELLPWNAPDHFLSAGSYAKRWVWYSQRGQSGRGLWELFQGHLEASSAVGGVEIAAGVLRSGIGAGERGLQTLGPETGITLPPENASAVPQASSGSGGSGPWIRFSKSEEMANAFERTARRAADPYLPPLDSQWGSPFRNTPLKGKSIGELPDALGPFREYTVYPDATLLPKEERGLLRLVTGNNGEAWTSWTHYGTKDPRFPFFRAR